MEMTVKINQFEKQYNIPSDEFSEKFNAGQLGDSADFIEWFAYYDMRLEILKKIKCLSEAEV